MAEFSDELGGRVGEELARSVRGRGAFRMFRDALHRHGVVEAWYEFNKKIRRMAADALESENIPFR
jgi:hypothetical protein